MIYADDKFEWEVEKAQLNAAKHGVTFAEARQAFDDPRAVEIFDEAHSIDEARYQLIGLSGHRLLFVIFTVRGDRQRIIHARKATKTMEQFYVEQNPLV
jgi:uncharacterized DUF497 family protein